MYGDPGNNAGDSDLDFYSIHQAPEGYLDLEEYAEIKRRRENYHERDEIQDCQDWQRWEDEECLPF